MKKNSDLKITDLRLSSNGKYNGGFSDVLLNEQLGSSILAREKNRKCVFVGNNCAAGRNCRKCMVD